MSTKRKNVCIVGAGNIGSRHLQAIKKISKPLNIFVTDSSKASLKLAKERYDNVKSTTEHKVDFSESLNHIPNRVSVAIVATSSDIRAVVIRNLLSKSKVDFMILEKLLFNKRRNYNTIGKLLKNKKCKTYVNCSRRSQNFYVKERDNYSNKQLTLQATGSGFGLITATIHFLDLIAYFTGCYDFTLNCNGLNPTPIPSKRNNFIEMSGTLVANFSDGSAGIFTSFVDGDAPITLEIRSNKRHLISNESAGYAMISESPDWEWKETRSSLLYQSELTNQVMSNLLKSGRCSLTEYEKSAKLHILLLEGVKKFLNENSKSKYKNYPFT
jgi:hypothetical protein